MIARPLLIRKRLVRSIPRSLLFPQPATHDLVLWRGRLGTLLEQITDELISACRVLFIDDSVAEVGLRAVEIAHRYGIPVVADCEHADRPGMLDLMEKVDHLIIGCNLAQSVTGADVPEDMVRALVASQRTCSVVTAGERGCWYAEHDGRVQHFPAFQVEAVDTTGCGDVFHGAYAASLVRGESISVAIQVASAAAALKATAEGGRSGIPDRDTVDRFLSENLPN